jgi:GMP synthase (glutamine-hydrolysing)
VVRSWAAGDRDDHLERGIDQAAVLAEIDGARAELDEAWRPLATGLVALAEAPR